MVSGAQAPLATLDAVLYVEHGKETVVTVAKRLVALLSLLVALAAGAIAYGGTHRAQHASASATPCAPSTEHPVALVPGLNYVPGTMIPRGIC